MPLETVSYISDLVVTNPDGADQRSTADDHLRNIKKAITQTFPNIAGQVSVSHAELNRLDGISANIETRLDTLTASVSAINTTLVSHGSGITTHDRSISAINTTISGMTTTLNAHGASISAINTTISGMTTRLDALSQSISVASLQIQPVGTRLYVVKGYAVKVAGVISVNFSSLPQDWSASYTATTGVFTFRVNVNHSLNVSSASFIMVDSKCDISGGSLSYLNSNSIQGSSNFDYSSTVRFSAVMLIK